MDIRYLNIITLIIGVAFISTVIIATSSPNQPVTKYETNCIRIICTDSYNGSPLALASLSHYFGTSVIDIRSTPKETLGLPKPEEEDLIPEIEDDDDLFVKTLLEKGERISVLATLCNELVKGGNRPLLITQSEELQRLSLETWEEVASMTVSKDFMKEHHNFQHAMVKMIATASYFSRGLPGSVSERQKMIVDITEAQASLNAVRKEVEQLSLVKDGKNPASGNYQFRVDTATEHEMAKQELSNMNIYPLPDGLLPMGRGFKYMDSTQSNDIIISPRYASTRSYFWYEDGITGKTAHVNAPEGAIYIVVHLRVAHSGNRDGKIYAIKTPPLSSFRLNGAGEEFHPIQTAPFTSLGEMYSQKTLGRNDITTSSIVFEVPFGLKLSDSYLVIDLGSVWGKPGWVLG